MLQFALTNKDKNMVAIREIDLMQEIDILPIDIKTKIVDKILNSLQPIDKSIDKLWIDTANKRLNEINSGTTKCIDGEEVFEAIRRKFDK